METSALTFARPEWLHALWLLPLGAALFWWAEQRRRVLIACIVAPKLRSLLAGNTSPFRRWLRAACVLGALGLLAATLAGPQLGYDTLEVPHRGRDVIIAMDVSRSMLATDVAPTRLQRAKLLAEDLVGELGSDRLGLVAFAGSAFLQAPLTLDHGAVLAAVDELDTDLIPKGGTNIAAAIRACEEAFGKAEGFSRAIVIISDGEELDADGLEAARQAGAAGIRIFTVGVGSEEGSEIPLGPGEFVRDQSGKVVQSRLDAARMREIAEVTGGFYVPLDEDAARLLSTDGIGRMQEVEMSASASRRPIERYQWPLGAAVALLCLQALIGERRRRLFAAAALWLLSASSGWSSGLDEYNAGNYEQARQEFEQRLRMEPEAPGLQLNAGTAAYRLQDYGKASEFFSRAMLADDPLLRSSAEFNLGNTLFRQGEGQEDKEKKVTDWKDAIAKYEAALKTRPDYTEAKENKERVEELLKQLEQEQPEKDEQKKDQKQDQQKGDQEDKKDQQQGGKQDQKDQQQGGEQDKKDEEQQGGEQDKQDQQQGGEQDKKEEGKGDQKQDQPSADGGKDEQDKKGDQPQDQQQGGGGKEEQKDEPGSGGQDKQEGESGDEKKDEGKSGQQQDEQQPGGGGKEEQDQPQDGEQEKKDQAQGGQGDQKDEKQEDGKGREGEPQKEGEGGESEDSGQGDSPGRRPEPGQSGDQSAPVPQQGGEKKEGELRGTAGEGAGKEEAAAVAEAEAEEEVEGKMSASQARALLRSLQTEEEQVDLRERRTFQDVSRDW
jgi:Ca-activated chloride channel family protein